MKEWEKEIPVIIERGSGVYLIDIYGKRYLDGVSSLWVNLHGHKKREIDRAIISQIKKISHSTLIGLSNAPAIILAKRLIDIAPKPLARVFYSDNGSTAIEIALKMTFQYWQQRLPLYRKKKRFIKLINAYHGDTIGSVSLGGIELFHSIYRPLLFETIKAESPYCYRCSLDKEYPSCSMACIEHLEGIIKECHDEIAGLVIEPLVQAAGGMLISPSGYLSRIRELCTQYNILMIVDEVATGFGRTGKMFACEHEDVTPDIMAIAKGITGGYLPLAATLTTEDVYNAFLGEYREFKTFFHGHSYTGNQLGCAAAIANLEIFEKERIIEGLSAKIDFLSDRLKMLDKLPHTGDIRQKGLMIGIELVRDKETKESYPLEEKAGIRVCLEARKRGMIIRPIGNVIVLMPPLITGRRELGKMVRIIYDSIKAIL